jgi:DGQHR domain-containing protein
MTAEDERWIEFPCLEVTQPVGTFYVGVLKSGDLVRLSYSDVRRIEGERREVETYLGVERPLNAKRVAEIKEYVKTVDASFPSSIIIAVDSRYTKYDRARRRFSLPDRGDVAKILDGQHRLAGLADYDGEDFELLATIFVDMDIENQAMLFATINLEQTKVNKSLAYDLYDYAKARSPQKTAHNIVRLLDTEEGSPFEGKIKILGIAGDPGETLSQAVFIDALLPLMSKNPMKDKDQLKRGRKVDRATALEEKREFLVFRNMFLDEKDALIARVLWNYFAAVENKWGSYWREVKKGHVLNRTAGFRGLMLFLPHAYLHVGEPGDAPSPEKFSTIFEPVTLRGEEITPANFPPGSSGQTGLRDVLLSQTGLRGSEG